MFLDGMTTANPCNSMQNNVNQRKLILMALLLLSTNKSNETLVKSF